MDKIDKLKQFGNGHQLTTELVFMIKFKTLPFHTYIIHIDRQRFFLYFPATVGRA